MNILMKDRITSFEEWFKEKKPSSELEEFNKYALKIHHRLNEVYIYFYMDIKSIQEYV
jgi:hypothetical protein